MRRHTWACWPSASSLTAQAALDPLTLARACSTEQRKPYCRRMQQRPYLAGVCSSTGQSARRYANLEDKKANESAIKPRAAAEIESTKQHANLEDEKANESAIKPPAAAEIESTKQPFAKPAAAAGAMRLGWKAWLALIVFVVQNSSGAILVRYTKAYLEDEYSSAVAVLMQVSVQVAQDIYTILPVL